MENNTELIRLEQFVETLLNKYNELKGNFHALEGTLSERDNECTALKQEIANLRDERSEVGGRVVGLIDRIEQWEAAQDIPGQNDAEKEKQGSLFDQNNEENQ